MYTNTFKNELTTDQKGRLLLNTCGILFYCRNGAKSTAIKRMQTAQGSLLWFLFCLILFFTSQSTIVHLCRDGWLFSNTGPDSLEIQKDTKPAFNIGYLSARKRSAVGLMMVCF